MEENNMIYLQDKDLIGSSKTRNCYLHPANPTKVIKIVRGKVPPWKRDANWKEWANYQYIKKHHSQLDFISTYYGFIETNLGRGLLGECILDYNGHVSRRLGDVLVNHAQYDLADVENVLGLSCQKIIENNIQLFDLNLLNILIQVLSDGTYRIVCVDIKGRYNNYELIPVSTYIPFFSRMKLKRRCHRLMQIVQQHVSGNYQA